MSVRIKKFGNDANNKIYVRLDTDKLEQIEAMLKKNYLAQIGVLGVRAGGRLAIKNEKVGGKSGNRKVPVVQGESSLSNADIGLIHEKGSPPRNVPRRSFLEVPLTTRMPKVMSRVGALLLKGITEFNIEDAYKKLAAIGEGIVLQAFPTSGYETWPALKRGGPSHLIKSAQLRQSISSRVVTK